ncbi:hypothetical protein GGR50DRAFT_691457 [Xylaria sp. CBS 124048]|nr:hypothetical protein GGR50DRAFT_691457 [Xylaria sp. CBS 124048]
MQFITLFTMILAFAVPTLTSPVELGLAERQLSATCGTGGREITSYNYGASCDVDAEYACVIACEGILECANGVWVIIADCEELNCNGNGAGGAVCGSAI